MPNNEKMSALVKGGDAVRARFRGNPGQQTVETGEKRKGTRDGSLYYAAMRRREPKKSACSDRKQWVSETGIKPIFIARSANRPAG